jgi:hypothetical protein
MRHRCLPRNECDSRRLSGSLAAFKFAIDLGLKNPRSDSFRKECAPRSILLFQKMRGWLRSHRARGPIQMGPAASINRPPACPKYATISDVARAEEGPNFYGTLAQASGPRASRERKGTSGQQWQTEGDPFARYTERTEERSVPLASLRSARVPWAFRTSFELRRCRFEVSIRRPEAHFARREAEERTQFASAG